LEILKKKPAGR